MSELHAKSRSRGPSLFWPTYMLSWALLAGGALTYLSFNTIQTIGSHATPTQSTPESNRAELDRAQLSAQVRSLNKTVASLRTEMARLKTSQETPSADNALASKTPTEARASQPTSPYASGITTSSITKPATAPLKIASEGEMARLTENTPSSEATTTAEVSSVKTEPKQPELINSTTASPSSDPKVARAETPATTETKPRRRRNLATSPLRPGSVPPLPPLNTQNTSANSAPQIADENTPQPKVLNRTINSIKTASLPVPTSLNPQPAAVVKQPPSRPLAFGTPTVTQRQASASPAALSLSTAQSVTGLRASWLLLTSRHPATFGGYQPRYVADRSNGTYRLLAGPILNHAEADRICNKLRAQSISCGVTSYVGSSLQ